MPRGRPSKRNIIYNFQLTRSRDHESELPQSSSIVTNVGEDVSQSNPNNITHENEASTSKVAFPEVIEAQNKAPQPLRSRPMRSAKNNCMNRLREVIRELNDAQLQESREKIKEINYKRRKLLKLIEREQWQEIDQLQANVRKPEELQEQGDQLSKDQLQESLRRAEESPEQRAWRLAVAQFQVSLRRAEESPEQRDHRLTKDRLRESLRRAEESPEERDHRLTLARLQRRQSRAEESLEQRDHQLAIDRLRKQLMRAKESPGQRDHRLTVVRIRTSRRRAVESLRQRERRLRLSRIRAAIRRAEESPEERARRLALLRDRASARRSEESPEERARRLTINRLQISQRRAEESPEERARRLALLRDRASARRSEESPEERARRLTINRLRISQRRAEEKKERWQHCLEEQHCQSDRVLLLNNLQTLKLAVTSDVPTNTLRNYNSECLRCGTLPIPEECVSNHTNDDSFGACCVCGCVALEQPQFPKESEEKMESDITPDFITLIKTEDDIKTEIKEEPVECDGLDLDSDTLMGYVPAISSSRDAEHDSEEELPLPSQVVIKEENFSDDDGPNNDFSGTLPKSLFQHEHSQSTLNNVNSNGLDGLRKDAVQVSKKSIHTVCPFCEETTVRARYSSHHLPRCKKWKEHLGIDKNQESDFEDSELSYGSVNQPVNTKDSTFISSGDGSAGSTVEACVKSSSTRCPFCEMTVKRSTYSSVHLPRCKMWKKFLGQRKQIDKDGKPENSNKCTKGRPKETSTQRKRRLEKERRKRAEKLKDESDEARNERIKKRRQYYAYRRYAEQE